MTVRLALAAAVLATVSCSNTKVARQWADPGLKEAAYRKTLVIVLGTASVNRRETAEDHVVAALGRDGANALRSWDILSAEAIADRAQLARVVEAQGADAILALRVVTALSSEHVTSGREEWVPVGTGMDYYGYVTTSVALYRKPDVTTVRTFVVETTLWDVASRKLVWSAESDTSTASDTITTGEVTDDFAKVVAKRVAPYLRRR